METCLRDFSEYDDSVTLKLVLTQICIINVECDIVGRSEYL